MGRTPSSRERQDADAIAFRRSLRLKRGGVGANGVRTILIDASAPASVQAMSLALLVNHEFFSRFIPAARRPARISTGL